MKKKKLLFHGVRMKVRGTGWQGREKAVAGEKCPIVPGNENFFACH